jgi:glyoxylase-like metal-dependent hydrolase (beta-lactamase superfamily II)
MPMHSRRSFRRAAFPALALLAAAFGACTPPPPPAPEPEIRLSDDVQVRRIAPGLWVHTTWMPLGDGTPYPANGMLLETPEGGVLIDTGWNEAQTETLLAWAAREGRPVRRAYVTHAHNDRMGGIPALRRAGVPVQGSALTVQLAPEEGLSAPDVIRALQLGADSEPLSEGPVQLFYPGPGHTRDNLVVWFPRQFVLFGGCLIKADTATTIGNVADADVPNWPLAVRRVRETYPGVRMVVPGHGAVSSHRAYEVTEQIAITRGPAAVERLRRAQP